MSLLKRLQTSLNKLNGNTKEIKERGYDEYLCTDCKKRVYEDQYNSKRRVCYDCWYKEDSNDN